jgi:hypothetical protein
VLRLVCPAAFNSGGGEGTESESARAEFSAWDQTRGVQSGYFIEDDGQETMKRVSFRRSRGRLN